ncbi:MAG TPA: hypothetical protein VMS12_05670 [Thermoanaerobaculia bacterium]|nr:hypothetical protein [Thermoanaerobaculia bacterium]
MNTARIARLAGLLYLIQMATGMFGFYAHGRLTASGDAVIKGVGIEMWRSPPAD